MADPSNWFSGYGGGGSLFGGTIKKKAPKEDWFDATLRPVTAEAKRLQGIEDTRGQNTEDFLRSELQRASVPTMSEDMVSKMFSQQSDAAARTQMDAERNMRDSLGAEGVYGGGYVGGLLTGLEGNRWSAVTDARTTLSIAKAKTDAEDRYKRFVNAQVLATQMNRSPSALGLDSAQWEADKRLEKYGIDKSAKAAKKSSDNNLLGGIISGGAGLLAGIL